MKLFVKVAYLKKFDVPAIVKVCQWRNDDNFVDVDTSQLTTEQIAQIADQAREDLEKNSKAKGARGLIAKITSWHKIQKAPEGKKIGRLEILLEALRAYIGASSNKWLFKDEDEGFPLPYYVRDIEYHKSQQRSPAHVTIKTAAVSRGSDVGRSINIYQQELGRPVGEILNHLGYYLETPEAVAQYEEDIEVHKKYATQTGEQFLCVGVGHTLMSRWSSYSDRAMEREGSPSVVVMDDVHEEEETSSRKRDGSSESMVSNTFWQKPGSRNEEDDETSSGDEDDGESAEPVDSVPVPVHPYVKVFDLSGHDFVRVHVRNLSPYVYDKSAESKLVLPKETKELVTLLVQGSSEVMEDIITGKTGGTIVISTGPPGIGKTLTAEVFSEEIERPLYVVMCSQLGTDEEAIEKHLQLVLNRASRWRAILLIDEADVYVHERGSDIRQNAIVGVFLRVLERYRGVLFLTSNRSTIIDDAIMSRATAWIRYEYPTIDELREIWWVLSKQYKVALSSTVVEDLLLKFPILSGRNVKNLLKLVRKLNRGAIDVSEKVLFDRFVYVSKFLDLSAKDKAVS